ncbi:ParB/RepB/Spo0J family partition protein [Hellea balneolensis]|uniref:ParB/RepB/Spo0J family partition protein n=1 Tax=Hellea balneolensis TaxID=287478 RepID=UPI00041D046A|nr:ParB/RepB/Spo0J family partition protein [Hellea balneolensis]
MSKPFDLKFIPFSQLHISELNMRHSETAPEIDDILPSIKERGIRQPLIVRREGGTAKKPKYGIVAGRRRHFCLAAIAEDGTKIADVPCCVMDAKDDALAIETSIIENVARLAPTEMEQYEAFKVLADKGQSIDDIAAVFGITANSVKRRLALGALIPEVKEAYTNQQIDAASIRVLTMATEEQQAAWLELFNSDDYCPTGQQLKAWLTGGGVITTDKALFDVSAYSGTILTDLFGEHGQFADVEHFWEAQNASIAEAVESYKADGWKEVILGERGHYFPQYSYVHHPKEQGGRIYVEVRESGEVTFYEGYITDDEAQKIRRALSNGESEGGKASKTSKPEMSGPMSDYINLHRHSIARAELIKRPDLALRLSVAHMICGARNWKIDGKSPRSRKPETQASVESSKAEGLLAEERQAVCDLVGLTGEHPQIYHRHYSPHNLCEIFARLITLEDADVMRVQAFCLCETLAVDSSEVEAIGLLTTPDFGDYWSPDDAFFDILRDKPTINAMVKEIAGKSCADGAVTDTAKLQKQIIKNRIAGHGVETASPDWLPRWAAFPAKPYKAVKGCAPAEASRGLEKLFSPA